MPNTTLNRTLTNARISGTSQIKWSSSLSLAHKPLPAAQPKRSNVGWKFLTSAFVVAGTAGAVYQPWKSDNANSHAAVSTEDSRKVVDIQRPAPAGTANVVLPATFKPWQTASLSARVSGYLTHWHTELGDHVKADDLLAEIETPELDQEVASAESSAQEASAAAIQAVAELAEAKADLKVADAQLNRVRAELELSRSQLARREKLVTSKVITQEEFDTFSREFEARTAVVAAAEADVSRRTTNLETRAAIIDARQSTAKSRRSNVERLQELQAFKRIVAPFDGVVTQRNAEVGMLVTGREVLFVVEDMSRVRVQISVPQTYSMQTRPGVDVSVSIPESSMPAVTGTITRTASSVDSASRTMLAEIELENSLQLLQPGSYAQVSLKTQQDKSSWTIPTNTVLMKVEGPHVAVVNSQHQIELRSVKLGRDLGSRVIVAAGISGDERLVVNPGNDLTNGTPIRVNQREEKVEVAHR
ncbi:MAG: efflux transporter periplasmic adaptor subunit [Schlesneria sp.]|nr:efflux transporter periplasmic adaptor subunit [Schlesneria sp.]